MHFTPSQTSLIWAIAIGVVFGLLGNYYITLNFSTVEVQLKTRILFDGVSVIGSILTILVVFKIANPSASIKNALAGFSIPLSVIDYGFLLHTVKLIVFH
jgi:H+/Cl- antiporter ClcA